MDESRSTTTRHDAAERELRTVALGRKNYLFAGSDAGGERAAAIYSLIGGGKLNHVDLEADLRDLLTHIADRHVNRIDDLFPLNHTAESGCETHAAPS